MVIADSTIRPADAILSRAPVEHLFSPSGVYWHVNRETISLLAGGRALLMQIAHPKVAAGVATNSHFQQDPLRRLQRTMNAMWSIVFDESAVAGAALRQIAGVHSKVRGVIGEAEGAFSGRTYDARDPELLLWVHATLIDSAIAAYHTFVAPLGAADAAAYYEDSKTLARLFDIPNDLVPATLASFQAYMAAMIEGNEIAIGPNARALARDILYPSPWLLRPAGPLQRLLTAGLLPGRLREAYGLGWHAGRDRAFRLTAGTIRTLLPLVPRPLRIVPHARVAERRASKHSLKS
jgi:uncharacterized protein (DUF2236 family)